VPFLITVYFLLFSPLSLCRDAASLNPTMGSGSAVISQRILTEPDRQTHLMHFSDKVPSPAAQNGGKQFSSALPIGLDAFALHNPQ